MPKRRKRNNYFSKPEPDGARVTGENLVAVEKRIAKMSKRYDAGLPLWDDEQEKCHAIPGDIEVAPLSAQDRADIQGGLKKNA